MLSASEYVRRSSGIYMPPPQRVLEPRELTYRRTPGDSQIATFRPGYEGVPKAGGGPSVAMRGIDGWANGTNFYNSDPLAVPITGNVTTEYLVLSYDSAPAPQLCIPFCYEQLTSGNLLQILGGAGSRRMYMRGANSGTAPYPFPGAAAGRVQIFAFTYQNGADPVGGRLQETAGIPQNALGGFANTVDPTGVQRFWLGQYFNNTNAATGYRLVAYFRCNAQHDGRVRRAFYNACFAAGYPVIPPNCVYGWTANDLPVGAGVAPATLDDVVGAVSLARTGTLDVYDLSGASWYYQGFDARATPVTPSAGGWTGTPTVMLAGDSITDGVGATPGNGWVHVFYDTLVAAGLSLDLVGPNGVAPYERSAVPGRTVASLDTALAVDLPAYLPEVLVILIGTNNITAGDMQAVLAEYQSLLTNAFAAGPPGMIVLCGLVPIRLTAWQCEQTRFAANDLIRGCVQEQVTAGNACFVVDTEDAYGAPDIPDLTHPNDAGHAALAVTNPAGNFVGCVRTVLNGMAF